MNSSRYVSVFFMMFLFVLVLACAHSDKSSQIEFDSARVVATDRIGLEFAEGVRLPESLTPEQKVFTMQNFRVGTGPNRILIVGVQFELQGKGSVEKTTDSSVSCGGQELTLLPGAEVQVTWMWKGIEMWLKVVLYYLLNPPTGNQDITVTYAGPVPSGNVGAISLYNAKQAAPLILATNYQKEKKREIITTATTKKDGAWVVDVVSTNHKSNLEPQTEGHILRFSAQEFLAGKSSMVCGTLPVPTAGEVSLHWAMKKYNYLAHIVLEIDYQR